MSRDTLDYHAVLGVPPGADLETIRRAFREAARVHHPSVSAHPDAERRFRELADAYAALSRPGHRILPAQSPDDRPLLRYGALAGLAAALALLLVVLFG
jgi:curved DNA-binding protein CbpA